VTSSGVCNYACVDSNNYVVLHATPLQEDERIMYESDNKCQQFWPTKIRRSLRPPVVALLRAIFAVC